MSDSQDMDPENAAPEEPVEDEDDFFEADASAELTEDEDADVEYDTEDEAPETVSVGPMDTLFCFPR